MSKQKLTILLTAIFITWVSVHMHAQEEAVYTQYTLNPAWVNPAYTGFNDEHNLYLNYRSHWTAFDGAPRTFSGNYHGGITDRIGLGVLVSTESIGAINDFRAGLAYAYRFGDPSQWKMSIGLNTEYESYSVKGSVVHNPDVDPTDPVLIDAIDGIQFFNVGLGFYGEYDEKFFAGISLPKMIRARINDVRFDEEDNNKFLQYFTAMAGYRIDVAEHGFKVEPSVFLKRLQGVDFQIDANLRAYFLNDQLVGGLSYSLGTGDRLGFLIGTQLGAFRLYYSYDVSFQNFQDYANGSHELTLGFRWPGVARSAEKSPM